MPLSEITAMHVLIASSVTALCTGLGVIPFFFVSNISKMMLGVGNAIAAGLMLGASIGLSWEAGSISIGKLAIGLALGVALVLLTDALLPVAEPGQQLGQLSAVDFRKVLIILVVMTAHSFAEGIGVGVSFGGRDGLGDLISTAIAIHNIPEGIAISLVLIPRGFSKLKASLWSIFSSLPQPLMAVPAFLFVLMFKPLLPIGLGLAAGAMFYMVFFELLPESIQNTSRLTAGGVLVASTAAMLLFQSLL
jgi:zinc transporter ZupT